MIALCTAPGIVEPTLYITNLNFKKGLLIMAYSESGIPLLSDSSNVTSILHLAECEHIPPSCINTGSILWIQIHWQQSFFTLVPVLVTRPPLERTVTVQNLVGRVGSSINITILGVYCFEVTASKGSTHAIEAV